MRKHIFRGDDITFGEGLDGCSISEIRKWDVEMRKATDDYNKAEGADRHFMGFLIDFESNELAPYFYELVDEEDS